MRGVRCAIGALAGAVLAVSAAVGQITNPVYLDESPVARETLDEAMQLLRTGNRAEAARQLQRLLDDEADRVVASAADDSVAHGVRARVVEMLLSHPELLEAYRAGEEARARRDLGEGREEEVERLRLLTGAGFEATLRVAQTHLESARFEAARLALEQLETHPDRTGEAGAAAGDLLGTIAGYLRRDEVWARAERWAREAGKEPGRRGGAPRPALAARATLSPLARGADLSLEHFAASPLSSAPTEPREGGPDRLRIFPTVVGEDVLVCDGVWLHCFDRFTLDVRWRTRLAPAGARAEAPAMSIGGEDPLAVACSGRVVVTTSEDPPGQMSRIHAFDAGDGRPLWSVHVPLLAEALEGSILRGPVAIDGDHVLFAARRAGAAQRLLSVHVGALDLSTGELRWLRLLASAGSLPFQRSRSVSDTGLLDRGIVYRMDYVGAIGAYEAATGRPVWVRKLPVADFGQSELGEAWQGNTPILDGDTLLVLTPDRRDIVRLDARTGELLASRPSGIFGQAQYLLRAGAYLGAVDANSVSFVELSDFEKGRVRRSAIVPNAGIRGRAIVAGDRVLIPLETGIARIDPAEPGTLRDLTALDASGNLVALEDELLTAGGRGVHAYATWETVSRLLRGRMEANASEAAPAITYAELAFRAGDGEGILLGADRAIGILDRAAPGDASSADRARLFGSLRAMVEAAFEGAATLEPGLLSALVDRLGRLADSHAERVSHLLALGMLRESTAQPAEAFAAFQRILLDPALGETLWRGPSGSSRADLEATRRIQRLVQGAGSAGYQAFEIAAREEFAALPVGAPASAFESLGRRYPAASVAPRAWFEAALAHEREGRTSTAVQAFAAALDRGEALRRARVPMDAAILGQIVGRLARAYERSERFAAASQLLRRIARDHPDLAISDANGTIIVDEFIARLGELQASLRRPPRLGGEIRAEVQSLVGWRIVPALSRLNYGRTSDHLVLSREPTRDQPLGSIALWGVAGAAGGDGLDRPGELRIVWERPTAEISPVLLRCDPEATYLYWGLPEGGVVERIEAVDGGPGWTSRPFAKLFGQADGLEGRLVNGPDTNFQDSMGVPRRLVDLMVGLDPDLVAIVERSGRATVIDAPTGRTLWAQTTPMRQVFDIELGHGVLVIAGNVGEPVDELGEELIPTVMVLDARTGAVLRRLDTPRGDPPRWVQLSDQGLLIVGRQSQINAVRTADGSTAWSVAGGAGWESREAWIFDERLFVLSDDRRLWMVSLATGDPPPAPVDAREHLENAGRIEAFRTGNNVGFASDRGVVVVDERGIVVGRDALDRVGGLLPAAPTTDRLVVLDSTPETLADGRPAYELHMLEAASAMALEPPRKLVLRSRPRSMALLEGRVVVTAGNITTVYHAPADDAR